MSDIRRPSALGLPFPGVRGPTEMLAMSVGEALEAGQSWLVHAGALDSGLPLERSGPKRYSHREDAEYPWRYPQKALARFTAQNGQTQCAGRAAAGSRGTKPSTGACRKKWVRGGVPSVRV
jgi:hypothetical protein